MLSDEPEDGTNKHSGETIMHHVKKIGDRCWAGPSDLEIRRGGWPCVKVFG